MSVSHLGGILAGLEPERQTTVPGWQRPSARLAHCRSSVYAHEPCTTIPAELEPGPTLLTAFNFIS